MLFFRVFFHSNRMKVGYAANRLWMQTRCVGACCTLKAAVQSDTPETLDEKVLLLSQNPGKNCKVAPTLWQTDTGAL